jgi:hypothetical protein
MITPMAQDTSDAAREVQLGALRRLGASGRASLAAKMSDDARRIAIAGEMRRHPELSEAEARRIVCRRALGAELAARVYPPDAP